jgi:tetraacyldisaccharide 4'-kinase
MTVSYLEKLILGENRGPISWLIRALLWPLSLVYRIGLRAYLSIYGIGLRKRCRLKAPVISVGNLTFGGTGKTPAVQTLCRMLAEQGKRVVVLSRGHGGSARGVIVVSDGERMLSDSSEAGDEPVMLARMLPGVPVIVGKDRRDSGRLACERFGPDVIVLDDGLQYWQLHRDLDIVVLDARKPWGSGFVMPMGDLREPASGLRRKRLYSDARASRSASRMSNPAKSTT